MDPLAETTASTAERPVYPAIRLDDPLKYPEWLANALLILGAIIMSISPDAGLKWHVFALFLAGHVIWIATSYVRKHPTYMYLNLALFCFDLYAIFVRI